MVAEQQQYRCQMRRRHDAADAEQRWIVSWSAQWGDGTADEGEEVKPRNNRVVQSAGASATHKRSASPCGSFLLCGLRVEVHTLSGPRRGTWESVASIYLSQRSAQRQCLKGESLLLGIPEEMPRHSIGCEVHVRA